MGERSGAATQQKRKEERKKRFAPQLPGGNNQAKDEMRKKMLERDRKYKATHGEHYDWRDSFDEEKDTRTSFVDKSGFYKKDAKIVQTPSDEKGNLPSNPRLGFSKEVLIRKGKSKPDFNKIGERYDWRSTLDEKCWAGYEKKGMKTMFGKRYPNCVKKSKKKK